jgi:hypothetical protein
MTGRGRLGHGQRRTDRRRDAVCHLGRYPAAAAGTAAAAGVAYRVGARDDSTAREAACSVSVLCRRGLPDPPSGDPTAPAAALQRRQYRGATPHTL